MGKLWIMIALSGKLVATSGPVPYGMEECHQRVAEKLAEVNADDFKRQVARTNDLVMVCEFHDVRPELGVDYPTPRVP